MKKLFIAVSLAVAVFLTACTAEAPDTKNTSATAAPEVTDPTAIPTPTPTPSTTPTASPTPTPIPTVHSTPQPSAAMNTTVYVYYVYFRSLDTDGNYINIGHAFYSACSNCGAEGNWSDEKCMSCGAVYSDRVEQEKYITKICDPNDSNIVYSESYEPFDVK